MFDETKIKAKEEELNQKKQDLEKTKTDIDNKQNELNTAEHENVDNQAKLIEELNAEIKALKENAKDYENQIRSLNAELTTLRANFDNNKPSTEQQTGQQTEQQTQQQAEQQTEQQTEQNNIQQNTLSTNTETTQLQMDIYTPKWYIAVLNKLLEEIEDTKIGISKKWLPKSGKETMKLAKTKLKQYKDKIEDKKSKLEKAIKKWSTPQIYETDIQQVMNLKSDIDKVRKSVSLWQRWELSNLWSFLYNSPEIAKKSNKQQAKNLEFNQDFQEELKQWAILNIFNWNIQKANEFFRRIAEWEYTQAEYQLYIKHSAILNPCCRKYGINIPVDPRLQSNWWIIETTQWNPKSSVDYRNVDRWEAFQQWWLAWIVDKALSNCNNLTPWQRNTWKSIAVLWGYAAGIFGLFKFFTNKKMWFWSKAWITAAAILWSEIATWENPISLFQKLMTWGFSKDELESRFWNAFWDAVSWIWNSWIECSNTLAPAMYSMMIFNPTTTVWEIRTMTSSFKEPNVWKEFREEAIRKLKGKYWIKSAESFSATFSENFDEQKRKNRLASFWVTDSTKNDTNIYEVANNASMNELVIESFRSKYWVKETDNEVKKKEFQKYINDLKTNNQALDITVLEGHKDDWFKDDSEATYTERDVDINFKESLNNQIDNLSLDDQKKSELKKAIKIFYDERAIKSKPNLDNFNLKIENWLLILTSHDWYETKINLNKKELDWFWENLTFTNLSNLLNAADLTNKILASQKWKIAVDYPPFQYKMWTWIYFNNAKGVRNDLISFNWSWADTRVLSTWPWWASKKIEEIDDHLWDYAAYLSMRRKEINMPTSP